VQTALPTHDDWIEIRSLCLTYQKDMLDWAAGKHDDPATFDGTFRSLIRVYQTDPDSPYHNLRYRTAVTRAGYLRILERTKGDRALKELTFRDFKRWYEDEAECPARARELMVLVRIVISFGMAIELPECARLHAIVAGSKSGGSGALRLETPRKRDVFLTYDQAKAICAEANHRGRHSIALAQAFMFELNLRQKDVIGEYLPASEPGLSDIVYGDQKWLYGLRRSHISPDLILSKVLSKSLRGRRNAGMEASGKIEQFNLRSYPMVMEELAAQSRPAAPIGPQGYLGSAHHSDIPTTRESGTTSGPLIICERTGRPWQATAFSHAWRKIARAVGVPDDVQNRDSRSGGITEGRKSGASLEDLRHHAGHAHLNMTARYDRVDIETRDKVARLRAKSREGK
jgi:hypothetical protein